ANFLETFPLFAVAVLLALALQRHDNMTVLGAQLYFWARLAYVPLYAAGIPYLRTLVWAASIAGIVLVLIALF
ncbi:MAG: MAPEG family protein, partial [Rhodanobacter sp.]